MAKIIKNRILQIRKNKKSKKISFFISNSKITITFVTDFLHEVWPLKTI